MEEFVDFVTEKEPEVQPRPPRARRALSRIGRFLTNKFFIATVAFAAVMFFLDKNDLITTMERNRELKEMEISREHYKEELAELQRIKTNLETDPVVIEKLAREKYLMKRDNEDIFLTDEPANNIDQDKQ